MPEMTSYPIPKNYFEGGKMSHRHLPGSKQTDKQVSGQKERFFSLDDGYISCILTPAEGVLKAMLQDRAQGRGRKRHSFLCLFVFLTCSLEVQLTEAVFHVLMKCLISVRLSKVKIYISKVELLPEDLCVHGFFF